MKIAGPLGTAPQTFQELIFALQRYWSDRGCVILQPYDMEVGAGTFHTATFLRAIGPEPHSQRGMPAHEAAQERRRILNGAALGQPHPSGHAELVAAGLHVLVDRLLAPGQRLGAGLCPGELDNHAVPAGRLEHS